MLGIMGIGSAFINAAGRGGNRRANYLTIVGSDKDLIISVLSCIGSIRVVSTHNGEEKVETYTNLDNATVSVQSDAKTQVSIIGDVTLIRILDDDYGGQIENIDVSHDLELLYIGTNCGTFTSIDLSKNIKLDEIYGGFFNLAELDLSKNIQLREIYLGSMGYIESIDLSKNIYLEDADIEYCESLEVLKLPNSVTNVYFEELFAVKEIWCDASNSSVATAIAGLITSATAADGTVYTNADGAYYSTIADAATAKGWTIEQL